MKILLASASPVRKRALEILGLQFETAVSGFDEKSLRMKSPLLLAKRLCEAKARSLAGMPDALIVTGDLFVTFRGKIFEKPSSKAEAYEMLSSFSGKTLTIIAGIAVYNTQTGRMRSASESYKVTFRTLDEYEIRDHIRRYPILKCSAAFESDGLVRFAEKTSGPFPFVTGLPIQKLIVFLRENGIRC